MSDDYDLDSGPDPADFAARRPEAVPGDGERTVHAVGIGPGNTAFLTPRGERAIREADVVVGFETVVDFVGGLTDADLLTCGYRDEGETLSAFADRVAAGERGTAVLMGDPNHSGYQFVGKVERAVGAPVRVVPGISSLQVAASRARTPMEDTEFVTLHKSGDLTADLARLRDRVGDRHLLVLPRPFDLMPGDVAADLLDAGADPSLDALVLERLTHDDEAVTRSTLGDLAAHAGEETPFSDLSVLAVRRE
ncbi:cobalt-precorrin-7 (C(5))-methyltransferase [Halobacterium jilantaiense]|uniref:Precorrin-6Y C5,15-methyltransferase (Decarboxylating) n=1 Tax=Halobacterium jilantaiense TaxID=355548 RepID=A0A1I0QMB0_9EURY|nr:cobalt-precorrin-7 (C(5))-methyltransferase [Halobacterium jilantaiense]SEW28467.1 precorrin-6Y C5,15-methyltransferase (decarboxylating) [Halobacterium jilantaiense]